MDITFLNFLELLAFFGPYLVVLIFSILGILNQTPIKSLLYVGMLVTTMGLIVFLQQSVFKEDNFNQRSSLCDMWNIPFINNNFNTPSISTYTLVFSFMYALVPMIISGEMNVYIILLMLFSLFVDGFLKFSKRCVSGLSFSLSIILGIILGGVISGILAGSVPGAMYFTNTVSNNTTCSKVSNKKFKCAVYKNGNIIKTL